MKGLERKLLLAGLILLLGCLAVLFACQENQLHAAPFYVSIGTENASEQIIPWEDKNGNYYVFLPGYAELSNAQIKLNTSTAVLLDGEKLADGMRCDEIQLDKAYELAVAKEEYAHQVTFVQSANVATMYIDTASGSMNYIHAEKGNEEQGKIRLYTAEGELNYGGEIEAINGRGNNTWTEFAKKPYSINLQKAADLLEMGAAQKWILLANADDPSHMRNKLVFDFAEEISLQYSPDSRWVDLYLNGEYAGLYLLCERNEVHEERVSISAENGYLVSLELEERLVAQKYPHVVSKEKQALRIHYAPEGKDSEKTVLQVFQSVENAILAKDGIDTITGKCWMELIDIESWVKKYLIEEVFGNGDGCAISQYFYIQENLVYAGPVWDYDHSMGTYADWQQMRTNFFTANRYSKREGQEIPWFASLYKKETYYEMVRQKYQSEFLPLIDELINKTIDNYSILICEASKLDNIRWLGDNQIEVDHVEYIKEYLRNRIEFLNKIWIDETGYCTVKTDQQHGGSYGYFAVFYGECLTDLPTLSDTEYQTFLGWYYVDTDEPFDSTVPITEDIEIYAKWEDSQQKRVGQIVKLMPLAIIACMGVGILCADIRRSRKGG